MFKGSVGIFLEIFVHCQCYSMYYGGIKHVYNHKTIVQYDTGYIDMISHDDYSMCPMVNHDFQWIYDI